GCDAVDVGGIRFHPDYFHAGPGTSVDGRLRVPICMLSRPRSPWLGMGEWQPTETRCSSGRSRCRISFRRKSRGERLGSLAAAAMAAFFNTVLLLGVPR